MSSFKTLPDPSTTGLYDEVAAFQKRPPLPVYRLVHPAERSMPPGRLRGLSPLRQTRNPVSGTLELQWSASRNVRKSVESVESVESVIDGAISSEDSRQAVPAQDEQTESVPLVRRTIITEHDVPVIGPGGRALLYADRRSCDVVTRKRGMPAQTTWRPPNDVVADVLRAVDLRIAQKFHVSLGYFELSKYERQLWMRPSLLVVVDNREEEAGVEWRTTAVVALSDTVGISLHEGLGSWAL
jgi:hypothetical protein